MGTTGSGGVLVGPWLMTMIFSLVSNTSMILDDLVWVVIPEPQSIPVTPAALIWHMAVAVLGYYGPDNVVFSPSH